MTGILLHSVKRIDIEVYDGLAPHLVIVALGHGFASSVSPHSHLRSTMTGNTSLPHVQLENSPHNVAPGQLLLPAGFDGINSTVALCLQRSLHGPNDGVYTFELCLYENKPRAKGRILDSPKDSPESLLPVTASFTWARFPQDLKGIRVISQTNSLERHLGCGEWSSTA